MDLFYTNNMLAENYILSKDESKHCISVLRKKIKDKILITEGKGKIYSGEIIEIVNKQVRYKKLKVISNNHRKTKTHIAISPTKNRVRFEWFLEKATEIGIDYIYPLICENSERKKLNIERCQKILIAALKQSKSSILPKITDMITFEKFLNNTHPQTTYIAHCYNTQKRKFYSILQNQKKTKITVLIGPEGDFSKREVEYAKNLKIEAINISDNILRTETAALIACHTIQLTL